MHNLNNVLIWLFRQATENGVIVITRLPPSADNNKKPSFRNPVDFNEMNEENVLGGKYHKYICAIIAPFWADAKFGNQSQVTIHA